MRTGARYSKATAPQRQLPSATPSRCATDGRFTPLPPPNSGGMPGCCGSESVIVYHAAFEATNICACGRNPRSPSRLPAGAIAMPASGNSIGATEPQLRQCERTPCVDDVYSATESSPRSQRKPKCEAATNVANGAPCCLRHIEQWQCIIAVNGPSSS